MFCRLLKFSIFFPLVIAAVIFPLIHGACAPDVSDIESNPFSLLEVKPYIGDETSFRETALTTSRFAIDDESVEGWLSPAENMLRFPIGFNRGAHLHMRLRVVIDSEYAVGGLTARVEFEKTGGSDPELIFETRPEQINELVNGWTEINLDLNRWAPASGELKLIADGTLASDPDVHLFWGEPLIYYPEERKRRNVLLIGVDTLRQDVVSPYCDDPSITPNLTQLAEESTRFNRVWSQSPWTMPSFASMITGNYASTVGAIGYHSKLPKSATTIGEILRQHGYATGTSCGNPWLGNEDSGFEQGMDSLWYIQNAVAQDAVASAKDFIERSKDRDWFCFLHFQDPHSDYEAPVEFAEKFTAPDYHGRYPTSFPDLDTWRLEGYQPDWTEFDQIQNLYKAEVAYVDHCLGELFDWMDETGVMDDTLVIFSADHGEEFYEHEHFGHGHSQFDVLVRTPLIIKGPGFSENSQIDTPVGNTDIVPTILKYLEIPAPDFLPGTPLQEIVSTGLDSNRIISGEECYDNAQRFAVEWPYKCIVDFISGKSSLYDLENDPGETADIAFSHPDLVEKLTDEMRRMLPRKPHFLVIFVGHPDDNEMTFSGTLSLEGGIDTVQEYAFSDVDSFSIDENTIQFDVTHETGEKFYKLLVVFPSHLSYDMGVSVRIDGDVPGDRFYPYGTADTALDGEAEINIGTFPWPANIPGNYENLKTACYVIAVPGIDPEVDESGMDAGLDAETIEQLRAIGYLN